MPDPIVDFIPYATRIAKRLFANPSDVKDAVQDAVLRIYEGDNVDLPWMKRVMFNSYRNMLKRNKFETETFVELEDVHLTPGDPEDSFFVKEIVLAACRVNRGNEYVEYALGERNYPDHGYRIRDNILMELR